jgi:hypothetical protein
MFVQIIEGKVADREGLRRQGERWQSELRPGATGFLGATEGVTDDGHGITIVRFESPEAGRANSERPEQGQWWAETEKCYDGEVTFTNSEDTDTFLEGGSNEAGFVQVMKGTADKGRIREMDERLSAAHDNGFRPDLIGGLRVWVGPDRYVEAAYFTSEADARAHESDQPPAELMDGFAEFQEMMAGVEFLDLKEPMLF